MMIVAKRFAIRHAGVITILFICFITCVIFRMYDFSSFLIIDDHANALSHGWIEKTENEKKLDNWKSNNKRLVQESLRKKDKELLIPVTNPRLVKNKLYEAKNKSGLIDMNGQKDSLIDINQAQVVQSDPAYFKVFAKLTGENVISMTLYGSELRYTMGAIRNAELAVQNFPGWKLRIYTETPSDNPRWGIVPQTVRDKLKSLGAELYFMEPYEDFVPPMMWRFLVADDVWVENFIVRDSDSRLRERDAEAVAAWLKTGKPFMCIRDHPSHAAYAISGGLWGGKPAALREILRRSWRDMMKGVGKDYLRDMAFLNHVIWPRIQNFAYCMDSVSCDKWNGSYPFPVPRYGYEHVGEVVNEQDLGRPIDIGILRKAGENLKCVPKLSSLKLN